VLQQGAATRTSQASISAALAVATANAAARIPSEQSGSLAEMAQRDLDAALQLLTDRAQYITGSSGAAIALRRDGKNDMLCRASTGSNAPELGALLSAEFGLSGESVRTRQVLRCDDIERDERVNREVCRQLGIASVAVIPVANDDEVLGVFELFSGKVNAFGERDLTALKRLSEMVETAVKLSRAAQQVPQSLLEIAAAESPVAESQSTPTAKIETAAIDVEAEFVADAVLPHESPLAHPDAAHPSLEIATTPNIRASLPVVKPHPDALIEKPVTPEPAETPSVRPLLWSMAIDATANPAAIPAEQGEVPATLRNLRKCEACGFPVSPGRTLCVECEEKRWRGQLKPSRASAVPRGSSHAAAAAAPAPAQERTVAVAPKSSERVIQTQPPNRGSGVPVAGGRSTSETRPVTNPSSQAASEPELVLSAAMPPAQSWIAAHKFVILTLLGLGAGAAFLLLR
jgi:hypothetical protein